MLEEFESDVNRVVVSDGAEYLDEAFERAQTLEQLQAAVSQAAQLTLARNFDLDPCVEALYSAVESRKSVASFTAVKAISVALMLGDASREILAGHWRAVAHILAEASGACCSIDVETGEFTASSVIHGFYTLAAAAAMVQGEDWVPGFGDLMLTALQASTIQSMAEAMERVGVPFDPEEIRSRVVLADAEDAAEEAALAAEAEDLDGDDW